MTSPHRYFLGLPTRAELRERLPRLLVGLVLFGVGLALMVISDLGLAPWDVFHQGISKQTGIPIGTVSIFVGLPVLLLWIPLEERIGLGTVLNVIVVGVAVDVSLLFLPERLDHAATQWPALIAGLLLIGIGSGFYIGVGLGPGPRDGLMTGLSNRGVPIALGRAVVELTVLGIGWLMGGTVGVGTVAFAFGIGPIVQLFLERLTLPPLPARPEHPH